MLRSLRRLNAVTMEINAAQLEEKKFKILLERQESYRSCVDSGAVLGDRVLLHRGLESVCTASALIDLFRTDRQEARRSLKRSEDGPKNGTTRLAV